MDQKRSHWWNARRGGFQYDGISENPYVISHQKYVTAPQVLSLTGQDRNCRKYLFQFCPGCLWTKKKKKIHKNVLGLQVCTLPALPHSLPDPWDTKYIHKHTCVYTFKWKLHKAIFTLNASIFWNYLLSSILVCFSLKTFFAVSGKLELLMSTCRNRLNLRNFRTCWHYIHSLKSAQWK